MEKHKDSFQGPRKGALAVPNGTQGPYFILFDWKVLFEKLTQIRYNRAIRTPKEFEIIFCCKYVFEEWSKTEIVKTAQADPKAMVSFLKTRCTSEERRVIASLLTENEKQVFHFFIKDPVFQLVDGRLDE
jgi:hypothetical protein